MYSDFEELCKQKGVRASDVAKATGISPTTFSEWKKGKYTPKADKMAKIADYFDVSVEYLVRSADDIDLNIVLTPKRTPLYEVSAGQGRVNGEYAIEYMDDKEDDMEYSWCTICGESMYPELKDGDEVKVLHVTETAPSDYTVVKVDGESATVKLVEITDNGVWLRAINKDAFEDRFYSIKEVMTLPVTIIGKVVEVRRRYG